MLTKIVAPLASAISRAAGFETMARAAEDTDARPIATTSPDGRIRTRSNRASNMPIGPKIQNTTRQPAIRRLVSSGSPA